jgi:hypothetical protein
MALIYTGAVFEKAGEKGAGGSAGAAGPGAGGALGIAPGDTLFAQMDTHLNSDVPSPVVATVAAGPLKGARAFGEFGLSGDQMRITFSRLALKGGGELKIEAFGVDPYTSKPSVRSTADHHHLSRWGGLIASSFIEGLGGAVSGRSARVYVGGDAVIEDKYGKTMRDSLFEAAGKAGERAAKAAERGFGRPPTVEVRAGEAVGILIITVSGKEG